MLERDGLIERRPLPADRRVTIVLLTPKAEKSLEVLCAPFMDQVSAIFDWLVGRTGDCPVVSSPDE